MEYDWIWEYQNPLKDPDGSLGIYKDAREREREHFKWKIQGQPQQTSYMTGRINFLRTEG